MVRMLPENAAAAVEQDPVKFLGRVGTGYGCSGFRGERRKNGDSVLADLWLGVLKLSVSEKPYLGEGDHAVGLDLSCDTLVEGLLVLLDAVCGVLGGDGDNGNREGHSLCVD